MLNTVQNNVATSSVTTNNKVGKNVITQENRCNPCNCSCICDKGCKWDTTKCTSKEAIQKKCTHCCGCFLSFDNPM